MDILLKRQNGSIETPASLQYGEAAVTKEGELFVGNLSGVPTKVTARQQEVLKNLSYELKMLQLQSILDNKSVSYMGGFIEGFKSTTAYMDSSLSPRITFNTAAHRCQFDSYNSSGDTPVEVTVAQGGYELQTGQYYKNTFARDTGYPELRSIQVVLPYGEFDYTSTGTLYAGATPDSLTSIATFTLTSNRGSVTCMSEVISLAAGQRNYNYYAAEIYAPTYTGAVPPYCIAVPNGLGDYERCEYTGTMNCVYEGVRQPTSGTYTSKHIDVGVPVDQGEIYLHYRALPSWASLTLRAKIGTGAWVTLTPEYSNRTVLIAGNTLIEARYKLPKQTAASTVAVQVTGTRANVADLLYLYDILVALR